LVKSDDPSDQARGEAIYREQMAPVMDMVRRHGAPALAALNSPAMRAAMQSLSQRQSQMEQMFATMRPQFEAAQKLAQSFEASQDAIEPQPLALGPRPEAREERQRREQGRDDRRADAH
jgi:hypothetical protein